MNSKLLLALAIAAWAVAASADTIKFKDGTVWEGEIISQGVTEIEMSVEVSGGAITTRRTARPSDVAEIILSTPAEKFAKQMEADYRRAVKFQLHPKSSFAKDQYDKVIIGVFDQFIGTYTNSARLAEIEALRAQWIAERAKINSGQVKFRGEWRPLAEVREQLAQEQSEKAFTEARSLMAQGRFESATQLINSLTGTNYPPATVKEATALLNEVYTIQVPQMQRRLVQVQAELPGVKAAMDKAGQTVDAADQKADSAMGSGGFRSWSTDGGGKGGGGKGGRRGHRGGGGGGRGTGSISGPRLGAGTSGQIQAQSVLNNAQQRHAALEKDYNKLLAEEQTLQRRIATATMNASRLGITLAAADAQGAGTNAQDSVTNPDAQPKKKTSGTTSDDEEEDKEDVMGIAGWFKRNWIFVLFGAGALLYLMNRFTRN